MKNFSHSHKYIIKKENEIRMKILSLILIGKKTPYTSW